MTFGIASFRADGSPMIDGLTEGGILLDIISIPARTSSSKAYPNVAQAGDLSWAIVSGGGPQISASFANGFPTLSWTYSISAPSYDSVVFVFATNAIADSNFGIQLLNDNGHIIADQGHASPQYVGQTVLNQTPDTAYRTSDNYTALVHSTSVADLRSGANKLVLLALPDVGTDDTWYALKNPFIRSSEGAISVTVIVYTKASTYKLPSLHVYALDSVVTSSANYAQRLYSPVGAVTFDSGAEVLPGRAALSINYPAAYGNTTLSQSLSFSGTPGIAIPYAYVVAQSATNTAQVTHCAGVMKRVGTQLTTNLLNEYITTSSGNAAADQSFVGGTTARYCATADITFQGPSSTTLTTPSAVNVSHAAYPSVPYLSDVYGPYNQTVTWNLAIGGYPYPAIQWYRNGAPIPGATSNSYSFTPTSSADDGATFQCVATSVFGTVSSRVAKYVLDSHTGPFIDNISYPSGNVAGGTNVTVSFTASGTPSVSSKLYLNGTGNVVATGTTSVSYNFNTVSGQTYSFQAHAETPAEHLTWATDQFFNVTTAQSNPVFLTGNPANASGPVGSTVNFTVTVGGTAPFYYTWFKNGQAFSAPNAQTSSTTITLNYTVAAGDDGSTFHCMVSDYPVGESFQYTVTSTDATLTIPAGTPTAPAPVFTTPPSDCYVTPGGTASFSCVASPVSSYQWFKNGAYVGAGTSYSYSVTSGNDGDAISVTATNSPTGYNANSTTATVHTHVSATLPDAPTPVFNSSPVSQSVAAGSSVNLSCSVSNYTSLQWYKDNQPISGATGTSYTLVTSSSDVGATIGISVLATNAPAGSNPQTQSSSPCSISVTAAAPLFSSYGNIYGTDDETSSSGTASFSIFPDGHFDYQQGSDLWGQPQGAGDGSQYEVFASYSGAAPSSGSYGTGIWYTLSQGIGWVLSPSGATGHVSTCNLNITVRLKNGGGTVTSGSVTLTTQNGGIQA